MEWGGSGEGEAPAVRAGGVAVRHGVAVLLSSGVEGRRGRVCVILSRGAGEEVRWSTLAGVLGLLGLALGVDGLPREDGGRGEPAGLGEEVLLFCRAGEAVRCLDRGLGLGSVLCLMLGMDCRFFRTFSFVRAFFSFSFSRSLSLFSFLFLSIGVELRLCWRWVMSGVLDVTLQRSAQRWWGWWEQRVRGLAEAERGQTGECPSLPLLRTLAALRLRARKDSVGVIRRSTMLLSHGLRALLRLLLGEFQSVAEDLESLLSMAESTCLGRLTVDKEHLPSFWLEFWLRAPAHDHLC